MCPQKIFGSVRFVNYTRGDCPANYNIEEISGIEENLCCPMIGVKGQIDIVTSARGFSPTMQSLAKAYNLPIEVLLIPHIPTFCHP